MERPSPVPFPTPLVVKKGSVARLSVRSSMPSPLSCTERQTKRPKSVCTPCWSGSPSCAEMRKGPSPLIASRALSARLSSADFELVWIDLDRR